MGAIGGLLGLALISLMAAALFKQHRARLRRQAEIAAESEAIKERIRKKYQNVKLTVAGKPFEPQTHIEYGCTAPEPDVLTKLVEEGMERGARKWASGEMHGEVIRPLNQELVKLYRDLSQDELADHYAAIRAVLREPMK